MPDGDGLEAVRVFRETGHGRAVVISAMASSQHRIQGLDADVDYYIGKPVEPKELLALLRQYEHRLASEGKIGWVFDTRRWCLISPDGQTITLTQSEIRVLSCFVEAAGLPRDRNEIIEALGKTIEDYDPRRLEIMIRRLRNKVKNHGLDLPLATVYGGGYCFTENLRKLE